MFPPPSTNENCTHASYKIPQDNAHLSERGRPWIRDGLSSHRDTLTFICPEGSPFWSRLLLAPPTGVNTLGRRGCFRLSLCLRRVILSDKQRGGPLPPLSAGESLSLVARHTSCLARTARQRRLLARQRPSSRCTLGSFSFPEPRHIFTGTDCISPRSRGTNSRTHQVAAGTLTSRYSINGPNSHWGIF